MPRWDGPPVPVGGVEGTGGDPLGAAHGRRDDPPARGGEPRPHRVEHRTGRGTTLVNADAVCFAHRSALAPYASRLRLDGRSDGELVLVDAASGAVVEGQRLGP